MRISCERRAPMIVALMVVVLGLGLGLALPTTVQGGIIATNLGQGGSFSPSFGYNVTGPLSANSQISWAEEFTVGGKSPVAFGSAGLVLGYRGGTDALSVQLLADNGGTPGTALETMNVSNISSTVGLVTATSTGNTMLQAGSSYWLTATAATDSAFVWMANNRGLSGHLDFQFANYGWWSFPGLDDAAFVINSADVTNAASVPESPSVILFGCGIVGLAMARMKGRRS